MENEGLVKLAKAIAEEEKMDGEGNGHDKNFYTVSSTSKD